MLDKNVYLKWYICFVSDNKWNPHYYTDLILGLVL